MHIYDLYGFLSSDLDQVKDALETCLDIRFVPHEGSFRGEYYLHEHPNNEERLSLQMNVDPEDGEPLYREFAQFPIILHVNDTNRSEGLAKLLQGTVTDCELLRHKVVP